MRVRKTTLAVRYLRGKREIKAAPYYGAAPFVDEAHAIEVLRRLTGQDFGSDVAKWTGWLKKHPNGKSSDE
jgi:hypothetical protein